MNFNFSYFVSLFCISLCDSKTATISGKFSREMYSSFLHNTLDISTVLSSTIYHWRGQENKHVSTSLKKYIRCK